MEEKLEKQLSALDENTLTPIVRLAIEDDSAEIVDWSFRRISGEALNPISAGVYRFWGNALSQGNAKPWSAILKIARWIDLTGSPLEKNHINEPTDWNYWKREALAYQSDLLKVRQGDMVPIKCYRVSQPTETTTWIWQEEAQEQDRSVWPLERQVLAAKHFGQFNGAYVNYSPSPTEEGWLCRKFIRQWVRTGSLMGLDGIMQDADYWKHPYTRLAFPEGTQQRFQMLMENTDLFCSLLEQQPQTISHQDTHWTNLFATHDANGRETTTVIDWSFLGLAAVGEDLGTQIAGNLANLFIDSAQAKIYYQAALEAYLDGLCEAGWQGEKKSVHLASAAAAFLRYATFELIMLKWMMMAKEKGEASWIDEMAEKHGLTVEETLQHWGRAITFLFDLGEDARDLASS